MGLFTLSTPSGDWFGFYVSYFILSLFVLLRVNVTIDSWGGVSTGAA